MNVVRLSEVMNTEVVDVARGITIHAETGRLSGIIACLRDATGCERIVLAGAYRNAEALSRLGFRLQHEADQAANF